VQDPEIERIGKRLHQEGLVSGNFGNISVKAESGFYITKKGAYLDAPGDLVWVPMEGEIPELASRESIVHREIYRQTTAHAVIHAHPIHAIAVSFFLHEVRPMDCVGELLCPRVAVVEEVSGSPELARRVAQELRSSPVVIVKKHGTFAAAPDLDEAYLATSSLEHACHVILLVRSIAGYR
jgi:L-fuculose-phosphate aldolase